MNKRKIVDYLYALSTMLEISDSNVKISFDGNSAMFGQLDVFSNPECVATVYVLVDKCVIYFDTNKHDKYFDMATKLSVLAKQHNEIDLSKRRAGDDINFQIVTRDTDLMLSMLEIVTDEFITKNDNDMVV